MSQGWAVERRRQDRRTLHVVPVKDAIEHTLAAGCWCRPTRTEEGRLYIHHSADGREREGDAAYPRAVQH